MSMDYLLILSCLLIAYMVVIFFSRRRNNPVPPGPFPLPIIGNLLNLSGKPHILFAELAKRYGPLMTFHIGQVRTVIISSTAVVKEALHKNDVPFSNHVNLDVFHVHNHHKKSLLSLPHGPEWRNLRKICSSQIFSTRRLDATKNLRRTKMEDLVSYVEKHCESGMVMDISKAVYNTILNSLLNTFFSMDMSNPSSELAHEFEKVIREIIEEVAKPNLADIIPLLRMADPQGARRRMTTHVGKLLGLFKTIINQRLQEKKLPESGRDTDVLDALLGINQEESVEVEQSSIPNLLLDLFFAGTDTTTVTLEWAMAELIHSPDKLKKAQAEIQEIIGKGNPVEEADVARLPYLQAVIKETLRLHPPGPLMGRQVDADVKLFDKYTVPKNTKVMVNVWAIGRDPQYWENPNTFEPERFLGSKVDVKGRHFELLPFGTGRRICPGMPLALRMVPLTLATLIHGFNWMLEDGVSPENMDMDDKHGFALRKARSLRAIPIRA